MKSVARQRAVLSLVSLLVVLLASEALVRAMGEVDDEGQFYFGGIRLRPYRLQSRRLDSLLKIYVRDQAAARMIFDSALGWTTRGSFRSADGAHVTNSAGLRGSSEYSPAPLPDTLRIAVYGDSYTYGAEIRDEQTWARRLEHELRESGIPTEVLNFGVGAYGMDQAYLRWQTVGRQYAPDIVIFGFNAANIDRNVNIFRPAQNPGTAIPFTKPRFVLEGESLRLVNSPTVPIAELPELFTQFASHPLARYEGNYNHGFRAHWWLSSRLVSLVVSVTGARGQKAERSASDPEVRLSTAIVRKFGASVAAAGGRFFVLHIPSQRYLADAIAGRPLPYRVILEELAGGFPVIDPVAELDEPADTYLMPRGHYSPQANSIFAVVVARSIADCISAEDCRPSRLTRHVDQVRRESTP